MIRLIRCDLPILGPSTLGMEGEALTLLVPGSQQTAEARLIPRKRRFEWVETPSAVEENVLRKLHDYLDGTTAALEVPVHLEGTPFQRQVWELLLAIPRGEPWSYGALAVALDRPRAARAVGQAVGANPVCVVVPCHRVVGARGEITGFAYGTEMKHRLLALEAHADTRACKKA